MQSLDPTIYFFVLGLVAGLVRAELRLPPAIYEFLSALLLLSIGLKGGVQLAANPTPGLFVDVLVIIAFGVALTLLAFAILRFVGRLPRVDAAAIAAHYGSVSVATFAVAIAHLARNAIPHEPSLSLFLVILEVPAIMVGILLARPPAVAGGESRWAKLLHEVFLGRGIVLLLGGLVIGWVSGPVALTPLAPLFFDLFKGVLALFLLEMGLIAASQLSGFLRHGVFLAAFAIVVPILFALLGILVAILLSLSPGGTILLATLAASASYIAAPAAMRTALPQANPAMSLTAALAITFPFNIVLGIPLYHWLVESIHPALTAGGLP